MTSEDITPGSVRESGGRLRWVDARGAQGFIVGGHGRMYATFHLPAMEVSWPVRVGAIPPPAACLQARQESERLGELASGQTAVLTQVLSGLGGVGKSQIAASYAREAAVAGVDVLVWATARSRAQIVSWYAATATELGYRGEGGPERAASWLLGWMSEDRNRCWLVVLDDLADPTDMSGLWPSGPRGHTIVTTRRTDAVLSAPGRHRIDVGLFTPAQAVNYLRERLNLDDTHLDEARRLAGELGWLPLALAQAAAFMLDRGEDVAGYRRRLGDRRRRLGELFPPDAPADDYQTTIAATWSISIDQVDALAPAGLARPLLELVSTLDPNGLPTELITTPATRRYLTHHCGPTPSNQLSTSPDTDSAGATTTADREEADETEEVDERDCRDALQHLKRLSLLTIDPAGGPSAVRVHALVQRATLDPLRPARRTDVARAAGDALFQLWPEVERDTALAAVLRANATTLAAGQRAALWQPDPHPVLWRAGRSFGEAGLIDAAITHWRGMLGDAQHYLGPDHPDTLATRHNLARWRGEAGDAAGAATAFERLLTDLLRVLGPDHPDTLATRYNLAYWRGEAGDAAGAATASEQLLPDLLRVLGPDHPDTLITRANFAYWRGHAGDAAGAATAFERLLTDLLRVLGPDHPHTLRARNNLARWRGDVGDAAGAATDFERLLTDRLRVLGPDHPDTLTTRNNLAYWRGEAGDAAGAATAFEQLLTDSLRVLGPDHPDTLATRNNLADLRGEAGDASGAATAFEQLLTDRLRVHEPDHPDTLTTRANLAYWRGHAGDASGAATAFERLLTDFLRVLGPDHPHTLTIRGNLARWRGEAGDASGAVTAFERLLTDLLRVLGPDHPDTLRAWNNLAYWRGKVTSIEP